MHWAKGEDDFLINMLLRISVESTTTKRSRGNKLLVFNWSLMWKTTAHLFRVVSVWKMRRLVLWDAEWKCKKSCPKRCQRQTETRRGLSVNLSLLIWSIRWCVLKNNTEMSLPQSFLRKVIRACDSRFSNGIQRFSGWQQVKSRRGWLRADLPYSRSLPKERSTKFKRWKVDWNPERK